MMGIVYCCLYLNATEEPTVPCKGKRMYARVLRVVDGDTYDCIFYNGLARMRMKIRVYGLDTPEKRSRDEQEKKAGEEATKYAESYIKRHANIVEICIRDWDKYGGRMVADVWVGGKLIADHLIEKGLGRKYMGGAKEKWQFTD